MMASMLDQENAVPVTASSAAATRTHFGSDFDLVSLQVSRERSVMRAMLTDKLRSHAGSASLGFLTTLVDFVTSDPALVIVEPDWTATQDLALHAVAPILEGPVIVDSRLVRAGKKTVVVSADVYDAHGITDLREAADAIDAADGAPRDGAPTLAARSLVTFARLPRSAARDADSYTPSKWIGKLREHPGVPVDGTIYSRLDFRVLDAAGGVLELDKHPAVLNSIGTLQGGAQAIFVEAAAHAMRPDQVATDIQVHYLAQMRSGPARSYGTVIRDAADHSVLSIRIVDAGDDDRLLTLTTVTLQRVGG